ncbi:MAG TPA: hypothetical protein VE968_02540 [Sphingomicrobium sp.]|nr:hypothetical protein [Sphingomicrobium sp.]
MSSKPTAEEIALSARWLAQALDPARGVVRLVAMDRESYRSASFLDDRLMQLPVDAQIITWPEIEAAVAGNLRTDARWIFHIGHVGSTLAARLLGEIDGVLAIREPRLLRDVAMAPQEVRPRYIAPVPKLMSRTFSSQEVACVKATSFASEIAPQLVPRGERALFMYARPRNYVCTILAGENSLKELRALEQYRTERLVARGIAFPPLGNDAERASAAWACEMTALEAAAGTMTDSLVMWCDFDAMLGALPKQLRDIAAFFGFEVTEASIEEIANGPLMRRYSKDLSYEYSPNLRQQLIDQELRLQGTQIDTALAMLARAAEKSPLLSQALSRAEGM